MKKKNVVAALALSAMLAVGSGALIGCGDKHEHTYSADWTYDGTSHWHVATCDDLKEGDKDYKSGVAIHVWGEDDKCTVCTAVKPAVEYTITLNKGEGTLTETTLQTTNGKVTLPTPTAPANKWFKGWYTAETGGEQVTSDTVFEADTPVYARYVAEVTITLSAGDKGAFAAGAVTTYQTLNGKLQVSESDLPIVNSTDDDYDFYGWLNGENDLDVENDVFEAATTITAKIAQKDGFWSEDGTERLAELTLNTGNTDTSLDEYWFGAGKQQFFAAGTKLTVYIDGNKKENFWLKGNCIKIEDPNGYGGMNATVIEVTEDAKFTVYIKLYKNGGTTYEFIGTPSYEEVSQIPAGCAAVTITWGASNSITLYIVDPAGNGIGAADMAGYYIYAHNNGNNLFGSWQDGVINGTGALSATMAGSTAVTADEITVIVRWSEGENQINTTTGNEGRQTGNLSGLQSGHSYIIYMGTDKVQEYVAPTQA